MQSRLAIILCLRALDKHAIVMSLTPVDPCPHSPTSKLQKREKKLLLAFQCPITLQSTTMGLQRQKFRVHDEQDPVLHKPAHIRTRGQAWSIL